MLHAQTMEQQLWQAEAVAKEQGGELKAVKEREAELEQQVTALTGQHNIHQRIQHHQKVKDENNALRGQLAACRDDVAKHSIRCCLFAMSLLVLQLYCCLSDGALCLSCNLGWPRGCSICLQSRFCCPLGSCLTCDSCLCSLHAHDCLAILSKRWEQVKGKGISQFSMRLLRMLTPLHVLTVPNIPRVKRDFVGWRGHWRSWGGTARQQAGPPPQTSMRRTASGLTCITLKRRSASWGRTARLLQTWSLTWPTGSPPTSPPVQVLFS